MSVRKIILVLLMPVITHVIIACCNCPEPVVKRYSNESMTVQNLDNSSGVPLVITSATVPKNAYGIKVNLHRAVVAYNVKRLPSFFQSAYAYCDECGPKLKIIAKDTIVDLKVFSIYDFDANHSANSDVSEYFTILTDIFSGTIPDYLGSIKDYPYDVTLYDESQLESELSLFLTTAPELRTGNKFSVQITLSDGRILKQETSELEFI